MNTKDQMLKVVKSVVKSSMVLAIGTMCLVWPVDKLHLTCNTASAQTLGSQTAVVTASQVNLRGGPGTNHAILSSVSYQDRLPVISRNGDWYQVQKADGQSAWIAGWLLRVETEVDLSTLPALPVPPQEPDLSPVTPVTPDKPKELDVQPTTPETNQVAVVTASAVNLRSGAGTSYPIVGQVNTGDKLPLIAKQNDWLQVQKADGQPAWIAGWLAKVENTSRQPSTPSRGDERPESPNVGWLPGQTGDNSEGKNDSDKKDNQKEIKKEADAHDPQLTKIKVTEQGDKTILRVEANTPLKYNTFMLSNPKRLVVDLEDLYLGNVTKSQQVNSQTVGTVRSAQFSLEPLVTRLVLDLKGATKYRTSVAEQGRVLVIETSAIKHGEAVQDKLIYIDPGHGGSDPGASGYSGKNVEKDITLDISLRLAAILREQGARVEMSRTTDATVGLNQRPYSANEINADAFISIHTDSFTSSAAQGTSTYFYAPSSRQHLYDQRSNRKQLAESIHQFMVSDLDIPDRGVREANFAVLRESKMPAVLVETAFISNPEEERLLADANFRQRIAEAIAKGINSYFMN